MRTPRKAVRVTKPAASAKERRVPARASAERSGQVQSLVCALTIVNRLAAAEGVTLTEVAQQVGLSPSTAHRLLTTLEQERYVHFDAERRLRSVGLTPDCLIETAGADLSVPARPLTADANGIVAAVPIGGIVARLPRSQRRRMKVFSPTWW